MKQQDNISEQDYTSAVASTDTNELVSLSREQLQMLQQINNKTPLNGKNSGQNKGGKSEIGQTVDGISGEFQNMNQVIADAGKEIRQKFIAGSFTKGESQSGKSVQARNMEVSSGVASVATGIGISSGIGAIANSALGFVGGTLVGAAAGAYVQAGTEEAKIKSDYDKYFLNNSSKFINMGNSTSKLSLTGFDFRDSMNLGGQVYRMSPQLLVGSDELQQLTMQYTESGLLYGVNNVDTTVERIKNLTNAAKKIATVLNVTLEEGTEFMSQMKQLGITDVSKYTSLASSSNLAGSYLGVDGSTVTSQTIQNTASLVSGTGISASNVLTTSATNNVVGGLIYTSLYNNSDRTANQELAYNYANNIGVQNIGAEMTQLTNSTLSTDFSKTMLASLYKYNSSTGEMEYNPDALNSLTGLDTNGIGQLASKNLQDASSQNPSATLTFMSSATDRSYNDMTGVEQLGFIQKLVSALSSSSGGALSTQEILKNYFGMNDSQAALYSMMVGVDTDSLLAAQNVTSIQDSYAARRSSMYGGIGRVMSSFGSALWQGIASPFVAVSDGLTYAGNSIGEGFDQIWFGKQASGSSLVTATDWINEDLGEKTTSAKKINSSLQSVKEAYDQLSTKQQDLLTSSGININDWNSAFTTDTMKESNAGVLSSYLDSDLAEITDSSSLSALKDMSNTFYTMSDGDKSALSMTSIVYNMRDGYKNLSGLYGLSDDQAKMLYNYAINNDTSLYDAASALADYSYTNQDFLASATQSSINAKNVLADTVKAATVQNDRADSGKSDFLLTAFGSDEDKKARAYKYFLESASNYMSGNKEDLNYRIDNDGNLVSINSTFGPLGEYLSATDANAEVKSVEAYSGKWVNYSELSDYNITDNDVLKLISSGSNQILSEDSQANAEKVMKEWREYQADPDSYATDATFSIVHNLVENNKTASVKNSAGETITATIGDLLAGYSQTSNSVTDSDLSSAGWTVDLIKQGIAKAQMESSTVSQDVSSYVSQNIGTAAYDDPVQAQIMEDTHNIAENVRRLADKQGGGAASTSTSGDTAGTTDSLYEDALGLTSSVGSYL